jgi:hypothetical protein
LLASVLLAVTTAAACTDDSARPEPVAAPSATDTEVPVESVTVTDDGIAGLLWMREEEQLAHDVYTALGEFWGLRIFENIAASEQSHIDAVATLLDRLDIEVPAAGNEPGTFNEPAIQELYDELMADGTVSLEAALAVGARIEELDIVDLRSHAAATDIADVDALYAELERGSRNHLRAFTSQLDVRGVEYQPTVLDQAAYDAIVSGETERGRDG